MEYDILRRYNVTDKECLDILKECQKLSLPGDEQVALAYHRIEKLSFERRNETQERWRHIKNSIKNFELEAEQKTIDLISEMILSTNSYNSPTYREIFDWVHDHLPKLYDRIIAKHKKETEDCKRNCYTGFIDPSS